MKKLVISMIALSVMMIGTTAIAATKKAEPVTKKSAVEKQQTKKVEKTTTKKPDKKEVKKK